MPLTFTRDSTCDICFEPFAGAFLGDSLDRPPHVITCGHIFCRSCLYNVPLDRNQFHTCPMCRKPYSLAQVKRLHVDIPANGNRHVVQDTATRTSPSPPSRESGSMKSTLDDLEHATTCVQIDELASSELTDVLSFAGEYFRVHRHNPDSPEETPLIKLAGALAKLAHHSRSTQKASVSPEPQNPTDAHIKGGAEESDRRLVRALEFWYIDFLRVLWKQLDPSLVIPETMGEKERFRLGAREKVKARLRGKDTA